MHVRTRKVVQDLFEPAIRYGLRRTFKHRDDEPSDEAQEAIVEQVVLALESAFDETFIWDKEEDYG